MNPLGTIQVCETSAFCMTVIYYVWQLTFTSPILISVLSSFIPNKEFYFIIFFKLDDEGKRAENRLCIFYLEVIRVSRTNQRKKG